MGVTNHLLTGMILQVNTVHLQTAPIALAIHSQNDDSDDQFDKSLSDIAFADREYTSVNTYLNICVLYIYIAGG